MKPLAILVKIEEAPDGYFYAGSADLPGLNVMDRDKLALADKTRRVIEALFQAESRVVTAHQVESRHPQYLIFVAVPAALLDECA